MKIGEFLNTLATSAGISPEDPALIKILASQTITETEIDDTIATKLQGSVGLLSLEAAKSNTELQRHFKSLTLNGLDSRISDVMGSNKDIFDDSAVTRINSIQNSYDRVTELVKHVNTYHANNAPDPKDNEAKALKEKVTELNNEILTLKEEKESIVKTHEQELIERDVDFAAQNEIGSIKFGSSLPKSDYISLTKQKVQSELQAKNLTTVLENGELVVKQKGEDGSLTDYFVDNQRVLFKDLSNKIAADNKYIGVSSTPPPAHTPPVSTDPNQVSTSKYSEAVATAKSDLVQPE